MSPLVRGSRPDFSGVLGTRLKSAAELLGAEVGGLPQGAVDVALVCEYAHGSISFSLLLLNMGLSITSRGW